MKRLLIPALVVAMVTLAAPLRGQEQPQPETPKPAPQAADQKPASREGQAVNIRLDVTITDQQSATPAAPKTLTMVVADNWQSRIRTEGQMWTTGGQYGIALNMDARPRILQGEKILLQMTLEYKPTAPDPKPGTSSTTLNESFQVILENGKPLVVSQSADPNSDRKVKLEVKATVLR